MKRLPKYMRWLIATAAVAATDLALYLALPWWRDGFGHDAAAWIITMGTIRFFYLLGREGRRDERRALWVGGRHRLHGFRQSTDIVLTGWSFSGPTHGWVAFITQAGYDANHEPTTKVASDDAT